MSRRDREQRPTRFDGSFLGFRYRHLDLIHAGRTFLRRRGIEHLSLGGALLHRLDGPDPGLDLHDHPWTFVSIVLRGGYTEEVASIVGPRERGHRGLLFVPDDLTVGSDPPGIFVERLLAALNDPVPCDSRPIIVTGPPTMWESVKFVERLLVNHRTRTWRRWSIHRMPLDVAHRITAVEPGTITLVLRGRKVRNWGFYMPTGWVPWEHYDYDARRPNSVVSNRPGEEMQHE